MGNVIGGVCSAPRCGQRWAGACAAHPNGVAGWPHSLALVATLVAVFVAGLLNANGVRGPIVEWIFDSVIAPGQATLFALTAFFMAAAAFRWLRIGRAGGGWMLVGALLILLAQMPAA